MSDIIGEYSLLYFLQDLGVLEDLVCFILNGVMDVGLLHVTFFNEDPNYSVFC